MPTKTLLDIAFNPQGYTILQIQQGVSQGILTEKDIQSVFGGRQTAAILQASPIPPFHAGDISSRTIDSTQVVFWGTRQSGKSLALASLLSLKGMKNQPSQENRDRITLWQKLFSTTDQYQRIPEESGEEQTSSYQITYRRHWWTMKFPLTFMEVRVPYASFPEYLIDKEGEQIHLFCLDCRQDIHQQADTFMAVIRSLEINHYLEHTAGLYILVTKTDLMNAPDIYRDHSAQTLVTSSLPDFWHKVQEICYDKQIYNNLPIPYSVGDFMLKDYACLRSEHAQQFLRKALLPKCQPRRTWWGSLLSKGKKWQMFFLILLAVLFGLWIFNQTTHGKEAPPLSVLPYDYHEAFFQEAEKMTGHPYATACEDYKRLTHDLSVERSIRLASGEQLLSNEEYRSCDSCLVNNFAKVITQWAETVFGSSSWSQDETVLNDMRKQVDELLKQTSLTQTTIRKYSQHVSDYFNEVKPLIAKSHACKDISDVEDVEANSEKWDKAPFTNDEIVGNEITHATLHAYESCSEHYIRQVNELIEAYEQKWDDAGLLEKPFVYFIDRKELKQNLEPLLPLIRQLADRVELKDPSNYAKVKENLETVLMNIHHYI